MKSGRLTKDEKYIIQGMHGEQKSIEQIATSLDRSVSCVTRYIDNELDAIIKNIVQANMDKYIIKKPNVDNDPNHISNHIINKTHGNKHGVAIMTQSGSEKSDASRSHHKPQTTSNRRKDRIYNIKEGKIQ